MEKRHVFEVTVYDGRLKEWRVLNLKTGTIYSIPFESEGKADASIEHGQERAGCVVVRTTLEEICSSLEFTIAEK